MKPLGWIGSAREDLLRFPAAVVREFGHVLYIAQLGGTHAAAKPMKGFGGSGLMEIVEAHDGDAYRVVYTVKFREVVYVLHAFQKKSKRGIATPQHEMDKVRARLKWAEAEYAAWLERR